MAVAFGAALGEVHTTGAGTTKAVTTSASVPSGGKIILNVMWFSATGTLSSVSGGSLTWTVDKQQQSGATSYRTGIASADAPAGLASSTTITATFSASADTSGLQCYYITGADTVAPDTTGGAGGNSGTAAATLTTGNANDFIASSMWVDFLATDITPSSGFTEVYDVVHTDGEKMECSYQVVAATSTYTVGGTFSANPWVVCGVAYKAAAGGVASASTQTMPAFGPGSQGPMAWQWRQITGVSPSTSVLYTITPAGSITSTGALANQVAKLLTGSSTPSGALAKLVSKKVTGSSTPAGVLAKLVAKALAGSSTPSGALAKFVAKPVAGSSTPTGALRNQINKLFTGSSTPSGTLTRLVSKLLTGSSTPTGALRKQVNKQVNKLFTGSSTPSGTLSLLRVVLLTFTGSITATGALTRQVAKKVTGTSTPAGALRKAITKAAFTGSITPAGALAKLTARIVAGVIAAVGSLVTAIVHLVTGPYPNGPTTTTVESTTASSSHAAIVATTTVAFTQATTTVEVIKPATSVTSTTASTTIESTQEE
jgi:hypothetical protein